MSDYQIINAHPVLGIVTMHPEFGRQTWSLGNVTYKKAYATCVICGDSVGHGKHYRPITNQANRGVRICRRHGQDFLLKHPNVGNHVFPDIEVDHDQ